MLTQSEIDAIKQEAEDLFWDEELYELAVKILTEERQRARVLQTGLNAAIDVIKQWHNADEVWDIYFNNAPEMTPIREAINTYNKNKPNDRE